LRFFRGLFFGAANWQNRETGRNFSGRFAADSLNILCTLIAVCTRRGQRFALRVILVRGGRQRIKRAGQVV